MTMQRNTWIASALFIAMCLGGITTLVSQSGRIPQGAAETEAIGRDATRASLDPGPGSSGEFGELLPLGLRRGREMEAEARGAADAPRPPVLRLR